MLSSFATASPRPLQATRPSPAALAFGVQRATRADAQALAAMQRQRLTALLQAAQRTQAYAPLLQGLHLDRVSLSQLPVSTKTQLMREFAQRMSDPQLQLPLLRQFCADPQRIGELLLGRYSVWESSGSTGQPAIFVQDESAMQVYDALEAWRRYSPRPLARLFDPGLLTERFALVSATGGHFASQVALQRLRTTNPWLAHQARSFSILQPAAQLVAELNEFRPSILGTYPTAALLLAEECARGRLHVTPQEVWTGGETLTAGMRARIEQIFDCPVLNSYGASEFLPMAWQCAAGRLHVNADWVILEPVDAAGRPMPAGQISHTTLLTNLANPVQPLIRFDIGDQTAFDTTTCPCGCRLPTLQVQGRRDDVLNLPGRDGQPVMLLPLALTTVLEEEVGVFDFQLQQQGPGCWCLSLGPGTADTRALRAHCRRALTRFARSQGAAALKLTIRASPALPLGRSGKLQRIRAAG